MQKYGRIGQATGGNITRRMRLFPCWIIEAKNTHSQYVIITAFSQQQSLRERGSQCCIYTTLPVLPSIQTQHTNVLCGRNVEF